VTQVCKFPLIPILKPSSTRATDGDEKGRRSAPNVWERVRKPWP
jgi:hypothetical protein